MVNAPKKPHFKITPSKEGGHKHVIRIEWPDGDEQLLDDVFQSEADAHAWVENDSEAWLKKHPKNQP
ncbi:protein of unknown function [Methylocella tundrae]|uniref:Uncharacterized protein n=1 Tax=Methylocella tundrae TaxID=227605 RepID=A0A4U8Z5D2_METTU|nr:protein of unknown function [Methylocella tundrae]